MRKLVPLVLLLTSASLLDTSCRKNKSRSKLSDIPHARATAEELDTREAVAGKKTKAADELFAAYGSLVSIRDQYYYGDNGTIKLTKDYHVAQSAWINVWTPLVQNLKNKSLQNGETMSTFKATAEKQLKDLWALYLITDTARKRAQIGLSEIYKVRIPKSLDLKEYHTHIDVLITAEKIVKENLNLSLNGISDENYKFRETLANDILRAGILKGMELGLDFPALGATFNEIDSALKVQAQLAEMESRAFQLKLSATRLLSDRIIYLSNDKLNELIRYVETVKPEIESRTDIPLTIKSITLRNLNEHVTSAQAEFKNSFATVSAARQFAMFYTDRVARLLQYCKDNINRSKVDCMLARSVAFFPERYLAQLDSGQQKFIESTILKAYEGPLH